MEKSDPSVVKILQKMPAEGFLKVTRPQVTGLSSEQRVHLIRKGNELFSRGEFDKAKKIFVSTGYTDGMIRLGDRYAHDKDYLSAYQMYKMAPALDKAQAMVQKLSTILRNWLKE